MALGVLNNLSAIYAMNNLNNTSNSLQTVLQQLSSGSRINSGADDSAGLSLVNGLQANSTALIQSATNAAEGIGLLKVADGALSQVTNLLNRAITLATEASNGTLNSSQSAAANQEYQSILSEITNIGSTTTYNQQQVFGGGIVSIYTGDSSTTGSSIDNLNIRALSSSNVGDSGGVISYSNGANNVFLNLSTNSMNASATDALTGGLGGSTTININYLVKGSNSAQNTAVTSISVGSGTNYANTANGLISAINNAGLGLTASFTTQAQAGVTGGGTQTGIQITGGLVSAGVDPSSASTSGSLNPNGIPAGQLLTQGQKITVKVGSQTAAEVTISPSVNTLEELKNAINTNVGGTAGLATARVVTNGDGTQSLSLADANASGVALTVTTTAGSGAATPVFGTATTATNAPVLAAVNGTSVTGTAAVTPVQGSVTFGASGTNAANDLLSAGGSITVTNTIPNNSVALTFVVGAGTDNATTFYTANHGDGSNKLSNLATTITSQAATLGASATVDPAGAGIVVKATSPLTGENVTAAMGAIPLTNANATLGLYNPQQGGAAATGSPTVTAFKASGAVTIDDVLNTGTSITLQNTAGGSLVFTASAGQTFADLALQIDNSNLGVKATWDGVNKELLLTSNANGAPAITASSNTLTDLTATSAAVGVDAGNSHLGTVGTPASYSTSVLQLSQVLGPNNIVNGANLTGQIQIQNGVGAAQTFVMGVGVDAGTTWYTGANTVASLVSKISGVAALGVTAMAPGGGTGAIYLQSNTAGAGLISMPTSTLAVSAPVNIAAPVNGKTAVTGADSTLTIGASGVAVSTNNLLASGGSIALTNAGVTHTFTVGTGTDTSTVFFTANHGDFSNSLANMATTISADTTLGLLAVANTAGLALTSAAFEGTPITVTGTSTLEDASLGTYSRDTLGSLASQSDTLSGSMSFSVGGTPHTVATTPGETIGHLIDRINTDTVALGVTAQWIAGSNGFGSVQLTSNSTGSGGQISAATSTIADTTTTANLSYTTAMAYNIGLSGSVADSTTSQGAATFTSNTRASSGTATVSYTDGAGQSLSATDLSTQADAQSALSQLNSAITAVAAQDGYIGGQINMLNSVSSVLTTQQQNVVAAQNAIQATDYASATSNMSKYEILSQTGIAALAQANSVQKEVVKLLQ